MVRSVFKIFGTILGTFFFLSHGWGTPLTITVQKPPPLAPEEYQMGNARRPDGEKYPAGLAQTGFANPVNSPCIHMNWRAFAIAFSSVSCT